jgi:flagellar protein FlaG
MASAQAAGTKNTSDLSSKPTMPALKLKVSAEEVQRASEELQRRLTTLAPELQISVDQSSGLSVIKLTDRTTNQVIQQFPSEAALQLTKELDRFQRGLLLNRKA